MACSLRSLCHIPNTFPRCCLSFALRCATPRKVRAYRARYATWRQAHLPRLLQSQKARQYSRHRTNRRTCRHARSRPHHGRYSFPFPRRRPRWHAAHALADAAAGTPTRGLANAQAATLVWRARRCTQRRASRRRSTLTSLDRSPAHSRARTSLRSLARSLPQQLEATANALTVAFLNAPAHYKKKKGSTLPSRQQADHSPLGSPTGCPQFVAGCRHRLVASSSSTSALRVRFPHSQARTRPDARPRVLIGSLAPYALLTPSSSRVRRPRRRAPVQLKLIVARCAIV
jgi:hypothetical protein